MSSHVNILGIYLLLLIAFFAGASAISTCTTVEVAGAEGDLSGIYSYDGSGSYIRRGGSTSYILGKYYNDEWLLGQGFYVLSADDNYPHYYVYDEAGHPVDITEAWQLVASDDNLAEAPSSFSITCADTSTSSPIASSCMAVEVAGAEGDLSGIYTYDGDNYIRRGGLTSYILGKWNFDQWLLGQGFYISSADDYYPYYYTFDISGHPVDINEAWQLVASDDNLAEAPSSFSITCADTSTSSFISSTCMEVEVAGAEGDISGTYTFDGSSDYVKRAGSTSYILGKYNYDQWLLGQGFNLYSADENYPYYYTYDAAYHPADIEETWQLVASSGNQEETPTSFSIVCADTNTSVSTVEPLWICASVNVTGAEGDLSGNYTYGSDGIYIKSEGDTSYILGKYTYDQWRLGEGSSLYYVTSSYPYYYMYDDADSPIDIDQEWQLVTSADVAVSAPSDFSVTCEGGLYNNAAGSKTTLPLTTQLGIIVPVVIALDIICGRSSCF